LRRPVTEGRGNGLQVVVLRPSERPSVSTS
jgi:hypothetical protein